MSVTGGSPTLSPGEFKKLARFIQDYSGIRMPDNKRTMLEGRLRRRLAALRLPDFHHYCRYFFDENGEKDEAVHLIDAVTTNKTDFFREPDHFHFVANTALPQFISAHGGDRLRKLVAWSAACSIGAEPYTLAMVLADQAARNRNFDFTVLATDICTQVLTKASAGIFSNEMTAPVPPELRERYFMRAKDRNRREVRVVPELRNKVTFSRLNLIEDRYPLQQPADLVFCRNILIYFDKPTQQTVLERICGAIRPGGLLFLGHSETIAGLTLPLHQVSTTIFTRV